MGSPNQYLSGENVDSMEKQEQPNLVWHRYKNSPGWVRNLILDTEHYSGPRRNYEIARWQVKEAFTHFGMSEHEFFLGLLLKSGAKNPLEIDFGCGRFVRKNNPGDIVFGGYQAGHSLKGVGPFESIGMYFPKNIVRDNFIELTDGQIPDFSLLHSRAVRDDLLKNLITQLLIESRFTGNAGHILTTDGIFQCLLGRLATLADIKIDLPSERSRLPRPAIQRAIDFMHANLGESIGLNEISQAAGVHKGHFTRLFRQTTGQSPMKFLMTLRLERAAELLRSSGSSIAIQEVAFSCGFYDKSHFSNEFRRHTGMTPRMYRSQVH